MSTRVGRRATTRLPWGDWVDCTAIHSLTVDCQVGDDPAPGWQVTIDTKSGSYYSPIHYALSFHQAVALGDAIMQKVLTWDEGEPSRYLDWAKIGFPDPDPDPDKQAKAKATPTAKPNSERGLS